MDQDRELPRTILIGTRLAPPMELMRWLHEREGSSYEEQAHAPGFHAVASWLRGVGSELPIVVTPVGTTAGLKAALLGFDAAGRPGQRLLGEEPEDRARNLALVEDLDRLLSLPAVQVYYHFMLEAREPLLAGALDRAPAWQALLVRSLFGTWRRVIRAGLKLDGFSPGAARAAIEAGFARVLAARPPGAAFLGGARPNGLDIVFAALASPVLLPERHGARPPPLSALPPGFRAVVQALRATEAGAMAMRVYATRPSSQSPMRRTRAGFNPLALLTAAPVLRLAARLAAQYGPRRIAFRGNVVVFRWADVTEALDRDGDFLIAPVNGARIEAVCGPFILGMDRSPALFAQRDAAYGAMRGAGCGGLRRILAEEPARLIADAAARGGRIEVVNGYARPIATRTAACLFGISGPSEAALMRVLRAIFHETFLNLGGDASVRAAGIAAGREMRSWIEAEMAARRARGETGGDVLGMLMAAEARGAIDRAGIAQVVAGLIVGSVDTTASTVANIVAELLADPALHAAMRADLGHPARFAGWCREALRRRPHNPILLRRAAAPTELAGGPVPAGALVVATTISAMQDPRVFDAPARLRPDRPASLYLHGGRGMHACAGRDVNEIQVPMLVGALLRAGIARAGRLRNQGPFPDELVIRLGDAS